MLQVSIAESNLEIEKCYSILSQLHPHLQQNYFLEMVHRQQQRGYQLAYLSESDIVKSVAGFHIAESFSWKKHLYVHDFVTDENSRSQGCGSTLLTWLVDHARVNDCEQLHLDSRVTRYATHKFYLNKGLIIGGYHFLMEL